MGAVLRFPWGRLFCVLGAICSFMGIDKEWSIGGAIAMTGFLFTALGLQALAVWRQHVISER